MPSSILNSDDGVISGTSGLKSTGGDDGVLNIQNNGTTAVTVNASGDVGIGTTSPGYKLETSGSAFFNGIEVGANGDAIKRAGDLYIIATGASDNLFFRTNNTNRVKITSAGDFQMNSGYGSVATAYGCRAWVNFNGTGTVAIRESGNVSSITDNGTGDYTVNFTTAMPDANYAVMAGPSLRASADRNSMPTFYTAGTAATTSSFRVRNSNITEAAVMHDAEIFYISFFR
jgi:hypothetical protein